MLAVNLILSPHNPYQEKDSAFECGFYSLLGKNRRYIYILYIGAWAEGSAFWLQIEIKGFEFPGSSLYNFYFIVMYNAI